MPYFSNPHVAYEVPVLGPDGYVLHVYTKVPLDCLHPYFQHWAREAMELEAIWLCDVLFDSVIIHQH